MNTFCYFTFLEPHIMIHIREKNQKDAHFFLINLFQLNYPLYISNKKVHYQEIISVHTIYSIFHACMWRPVVNMLWLESDPIIKTRHHIHAWKILYAVCTVITWWQTCLFKTCSRGQSNWNKLMRKKCASCWSSRKHFVTFCSANIKPGKIQIQRFFKHNTFLNTL